MTYSTTLTVTQTFTIADAKYLASRIAADLSILRQYHDYPSSEDVQNFAVEAGVLLKFSMLECVKYGFKNESGWVFALSYSANYLGQLEADDNNPGSIPAVLELAGATGHSYLETRHNPNLSEEERAAVKALIPVSRVSGIEPSSYGGVWSPDNSYYRNGVGLARSNFRRY